MNANKVILLLAGLMTFSFVGIAASQIEEGTVITFDDRNSISYISTGPYAPAILLKGIHDGVEFDWPVDVTNDHVGVLIYDIQYMDKDHVWIFSRLGHAANGATLLNVSSRTRTKSYVGSDFTLSPDKRNLARLDKVFGRDGSLHASYLFIDDVLLYPRIRTVQFSGPFPTDEEYLACESALFSKDQRLVEQRLFWRDGALVYALKDSNDRYEARSIDLGTTGEDAGMKSAPLSARRANLSQLKASTVIEGAVGLEAFDEEMSRLGYPGRAGGYTVRARNIVGP